MTSAGTMAAWVIRPDRLGDPVDAMQLEDIEVPEPGPGEVRVRVMAAGVNYNGVWAAAGLPVSIFRYTGYDFHIAGSDASGVVDKVGPGVTRWEPGDEVVVRCAAVRPARRERDRRGLDRRQDRARPRARGRGRDRPPRLRAVRPRHGGAQPGRDQAVRRRHPRAHGRRRLRRGLRARRRGD